MAQQNVQFSGKAFKSEERRNMNMSPSNVADIFQKLNDPSLVSSFQKLCGVKFVTSTGKTNVCDADSDHHHHGTKPATSLSETRKYDHLTVNDCQSNGTTVRQREVDRKVPNNTLEAHRSECKSDSKSPDNSFDTRDHMITYKWLHYLFEFGASLGNELFYILFFPCWFWNIDGYVGRRVCVFWAIFMYLGQATKDIVKWPRPASPPVVRMEKRYALEYGMPSTHAMVGAGLPFSVLILTYERYEYPVQFGLLVCVAWCCLVCLSRIYLGMHTVLDILAGLAYVFGLMLVCLPFLDTIDHFMLTHPYSPAVCVVLPLALCLCYPTLDRWSTARGDTTLILGVEAGVSLGHWVSYQYGFMQRASTPPPYEIIYPTWNWLGLMILRLTIGSVILFGTRAIMKLLSYNLVCYILGVTKEDMMSKQKLSIELPYKFITYLSVAFNCVYTAPQVFRYLGIERETYFTEI